MTGYDKTDKYSYCTILVFHVWAANYSSFYTFAQMP